jgi:haloacid dehalogenase superfamily, subfamily IA, variant 3 with third motif having DD or ED
MIDRVHTKRKIYLLPKGAYIFDNDGVLVDTEPKWFEAYVRLLKLYRIDYDMSVHRQIMGQSARSCIEFIQKIFPELPQNGAGTDELLKKRAFFIQEVKTESPIRPKPGVIEFLDEVKKKNIRIAMATGTSRDDISAQLASLGWENMFDAVVAGDEITHSKPAPDVYLEAARRVGVEPKFCLAFEDGVSGLLSAKAAGMNTVFMHDERFDVAPPFTPSLTINSFEELL